MFAFHKARDVAVAFTLKSQEGFQMVGDDSMQRVVFRIAGPVGAADCHEGAASRNPGRNSVCKQRHQQPE
jgi:hypothetical protein